MNFKIPLNPRTKKNSMQIFYNKRINRPFITQSKLYKEYEAEAEEYMPKLKTPIDYRFNIKAMFYRGSKHNCDLNNLQAALADIMVKYGVIKDDSWKYLVSWDGSRICFDKENPRTEVFLTKSKE